MNPFSNPLGVMLASEGASLYQQGRWREALDSFNRALTIFRASRDRAAEGRTLTNIGVIYLSLGESQRALGYYADALEICRAMGDQSSEAATLNNIGEVYRALGRPHEALEHYTEALPIFQAIGHREGEASSLNNKGLAYYALGQPRKALHYYSKALPIYRGIPNRAREGTALSNIGLAYHELGELQEALGYYTAALAIREEVQDLAGRGATLNSLGDLYRVWGQHQDALHYHTQALTICREIGNKPDEAKILGNIGLIYRALNELQDALRYHTDALAIFREIGDRAGEGTTLDHTGSVYRELNQPQEALHYHTQALAIASEMGHRGGIGTILNNIGFAHDALGQSQEALRYYTDALAICSKIEDQFGEGKILGNMGVLCTNLGRLPVACQHFETACRLFEETRQQVLNDETRASFFAEMQWVFQHYVRALIHREQKKKVIPILNQLFRSRIGISSYSAEAFHVWERGRARALLDLLAESHQDVYKDIEPQLAEQKSELLTQLTFAQNRLMQSDLSEDDRREWLSRRNDIDLQLDRLEARLRAESPHYAAHLRPTPLTLRNVQEQVLDEKTVLFEYALCQGSSYLWAAAKDGWGVYTLPPVAEIREKVEEFIALLKDSKEYNAQAAYELYRLLVQPAEHFIEKSLKDKESPGRLIIVPDYVLHFLPFELLLTEPPDGSKNLSRHAESNESRIETEVENSSQSRKGNPAKNLDDIERAFAVRDAQATSGLPYLLHRYAIVYAPSATVLATVKREGTARERRTWEKDFIGYAPVEFQKETKLDHTEQEVKGIARLFPDGRATPIIHQKATKSAAQSANLKKYRYIHFATHGRADADKPQFCGLLFPGTDGDVRLHTFEIFNLELDADLVVASACVTGLGKQVQGEGMMGMMRAFFYAGTPSVCVSLWNVADESTADLMLKFYQYLIAGEVDKAEALRQAKLEMIAEGRWTHPYHWAAFVLVGDWD